MVDTPEGRKQGSAVTEVSVDISRSLAGPYSPKFTVKGEAVVVDLGSGKHLFALLSDSAPNQTATMPEAAFGVDHWIGRTTETREEAYNYFAGIKSFRGARELGEFYWPNLVTFTRISDPNTFRVIDPRHMFSALGSGYKLISMTVEMTDEPPSHGRIEAVLPWLAASPPNLLEDAEVANRLPGMSKVMFVRD